MEFNVKSGAVDKQKTDCLIIGVQKTGQLPSFKSINTLTKGLLASIIKQGDISFKPGKTLLLHHVPGALCTRLLMVSTGKQTKAMKEGEYQTLANNMITELSTTGAKEAIIAINDITVKNRDLFWVARQLVEIIEYQLYKFDQLKSKEPDHKTPSLKKITLLTDNETVATVNTAIQQGLAIAKGRNIARTLGNLPGNICHPSYLAEEAKKLAKQHPKLSTKVLNEKQMYDLGMHSLLSVSTGSEQEAKLILMEYKNGPRSLKPLVLLGKGVTFDSGGISLKPGRAMDEMKFDMCGAASIFGVINAIIEMNLPLNVIGMVAAAENMPDGKASRPGDIVKSMSGKTIEILNTDAEGRLVLCDALTYAERYNPEAVIDVATLTGACIVALGHHTSGMLSNNDTVATELLNASTQASDKVWRLPMGEEYKKQLDSNFADMANIGGASAGTITAACFLSQFTEKYPWAHLDIAGTAWSSGKDKGASGRPVPMLVQYLLNKVK
ncbi:MAG: leucyl aminopeptidase [Candidatus Endonucleobacter sp. (ex Gigantidas childressi)]|nr:leucyl aminopeptidase [Candidatus Endonucleobacter sp. (ex Gigantidas childressi)]